MPLETGTYINSLVATNPAATDALSVADDHLRLIKSTIINSFPGITGAVNATHTEINVMDGDTAATATTLVDDDRMVMNDDGTMKQVALSDLQTYLTSNLAITSAMITDGTIQTADIADGQITQAKLSSAVTLIPAGVVTAFAGTVAPSGYLMCYGQTVNRTQYPDLYAAIGDTYGPGDGSTTFQLPDLRGRTVAGQDDMGGSSANRLTGQLAGQMNGDTLGATGGTESVTLTTGQMPAHTHTGSVDLRTNWESGYSTKSPVGTGDSRYDNTGTSPSFTTDSTGGGAAHNNLQPTIILNYIIKT